MATVLGNRASGSVGGRQRAARCLALLACLALALAGQGRGEEAVADLKLAGDLGLDTKGKCETVHLMTAMGVDVDVSQAFLPEEATEAWRQFIVWGDQRSARMVIGEAPSTAHAEALMTMVDDTVPLVKASARRALLAMDLESLGRTWKESKVGDDVQHGEEDEGQQAKATFGSRGGVLEQVVLISLRPHRLLTELS